MRGCGLLQSQARRAYRTARHEDADLVMISQNYNTTRESPILARRDYVEIVFRKNKKVKTHGRRSNFAPIDPGHSQGRSKGRLVNVFLA